MSTPFDKPAAIPQHARDAKRRREAREQRKRNLDKLYSCAGCETEPDGVTPRRTVAYVPATLSLQTGRQSLQ